VGVEAKPIAVELWPLRHWFGLEGRRRPGVFVRDAECRAGNVSQSACYELQLVGVDLVDGGRHLSSVLRGYIEFVRRRSR
jgi:hypothetical protein